MSLVDDSRDTLSKVFEEESPQLRRMISFRMDRRIKRRVDPSDVVQEAYVEAVRRLPAFLSDPKVPVVVWLRFLTYQKLLQIQQAHLGVQARDARLELPMQGLGDSSLDGCAAQLTSRDDSPGSAVVKAELKQRLRSAMEELDARDRQIIALRQFQQLKNGAVARLLKISEKACSKRYFRALARLRRLLQESP